MPNSLANLNHADINHAVEIADRVWWVGHVIPDDNFQCHVYLLEQGDQSVLFDPGSRLTFAHTLRKIEEVLPLSAIRWYVCHHQDPDIAAALPSIDELCTRDDAAIVTHWRAKALLKHYGLKLPFWLVDANEWRLELEDRTLEFIRCRPWRAKRRPVVPGRRRRERIAAVAKGRSPAAAEAICRAHLIRRQATEPLQVTASLGIADRAPDEDVDSLVQRADMALYQAKGAGRNRYAIADPRSNPPRDLRSRPTNDQRTSNKGIGQDGQSNWYLIRRPRPQSALPAGGASPPRLTTAQGCWLAGPVAPWGGI